MIYFDLDAERHQCIGFLLFFHLAFGVYAKATKMESFAHMHHLLEKKSGPFIMLQNACLIGKLYM